MFLIPILHFNQNRQGPRLPVIAGKLFIVSNPLLYGAQLGLKPSTSMSTRSGTIV